MTKLKRIGGGRRMIYVIERIRGKKGEHTDDMKRREGQRVEITDISLGIPLFARYIDREGEQYLRTSEVEAHSGEGLDARMLIVQTRNSVYTFRKVSADVQ